MHSIRHKQTEPMDDSERAKERRKGYFRSIGHSLDRQVPEEQIVSELFRAGLSSRGIGITFPQARAAVRLMVEAGSERWVVDRLEDSIPPIEIINELVAEGYERYEAEDFLVRIANLWGSVYRANEEEFQKGLHEISRQCVIGCWTMAAVIACVVIGVIAAVLVFRG